MWVCTSRAIATVQILVVAQICVQNIWNIWLKYVFKIFGKGRRHHLQSQCWWIAIAIMLLCFQIYKGFMFWFVFWWLHGAWIRVAPKTGMIQEKKIMNQTKDFKHQNHIQSPCDGIIVIVNVVHILQGTNKITWIEHLFWQSAIGLQGWA